MMIDAGLLRAGFYTLFDQMHKIRGTEFAQSREAFGPGVDGQSDIVILNDPTERLSDLTSKWNKLDMGRETDSGTAGASIAVQP